MLIDVPNSTSSPQGLLTLLRHPAPGRMRVRVRGLFRNPVMQDALEKEHDRLQGIVSLSANALTGNVLVIFRQSMSVDDVLGLLEAHAIKFSLPTEASLSPTESRTAGQSSGIGVSLKFRKRFKSGSTAPSAVATTQARKLPAWHTLPSDDVLGFWETRSSGLTETEARQRLAVHGYNLLKENERRSHLSMFTQQFMSPPVALLGASAVISVATGGAADALVIVGVVMVNAVIGYFTESQAEKTINALGNDKPKEATVIRNGQRIQTQVADIVPGDILLLAPGTHVPADARILQCEQMSVDESALTGESVPVSKKQGFVGEKDTPLGDRKNMIYMGTIITGGSGQAVVVASGSNTEIGVIQSLVGEVKTPQTPMQQQLDDLGHKLALGSAVICAAVFGMGLLRGSPWLQMLKSSISLAVAAVPEGLPMVATSTLALGIREMKRRHVLVRQLPSVESLGSIQTLCLDKTGTLTENVMRVVSIETTSETLTVNKDGVCSRGTTIISPMEHENLSLMLQIVTLCSDVVITINAGQPHLEGSPTEMAMVDVALKSGIDGIGIRQQLPQVGALYRAEGRPYMATIHARSEGDFLVTAKGSPSHLLALCTHIHTHEGIQVLDDDTRTLILDQNEAMAADALRVLGTAYKYTPEKNTETATTDLVWVGHIAMEDSMRPGMAELMARFHDAGIDTVMITGDQSATAQTFGRRLSLNGNKPMEILDSSNLESLDPEILKGMVKDTTVFARVSPSHKLRIIQAMQANGRVVAMTGDGINDGPALKGADVGVALGDKGSDVARSVADVVLEDDNLHTMITAVEQGRTIYSNIRKSLQYLLAGNLAEIEIMLITTAMGAGEALNPMQLLWINLVTDILPAVGLSLEPPEADVLKQKPRDPKEKILREKDMYRLLRQSLVVSAGTLSVYGYSMMRYGPGANASTNSFMTLTLAQLLHAISCRSETTTVMDDLNGRKTNPALNSAIGVSLGLQVLAATFPPLRTLLRLSPITPVDWLAILAGSAVPFVINEAGKPGGLPKLIGNSKTS